VTTAALAQGVVDAIVVSPPTAQQAAAQGFSLVVDLIAEKSPFGYSAIGVDKGWAKDHHDILVEYLQAYAESVQYAKDHPEAAYAVEKSELGLTDDAIIKSVYDVSVGLMPAYPVTDEKTVQATISLSDNAKVAAADPSSLYDNSYVEEAQKNG
jgi:ABC-type nitrate/sulfonate/bicarbonate transport system substrate-binding protein